LKDNNGFITKNELKNVMGSEMINEAVWEELLEECDINKDGKVFFFFYLKVGNLN